MSTAARHLYVLSLGAGVQSTTLYLWACDSPARLTIDAAIFADTGDEPRPVYDHLACLESLGGPPIIRASAGARLSDAIKSGMNSTGQRFASIPAHLVDMSDGIFGQRTVRRAAGMQRRQCTSDFKVRVIERTIRRQLFGLPPGSPLRRGDSVTQYIGFSIDEEERALRRGAADSPRGWSVKFPLIEAEMDRADCEAYLRERVPHHVMRSACTFCPYRTDAEWLDLRTRDPSGFDQAVELDEVLRRDVAAARGMRCEMYVHHSRLPLALVQFRPSTDQRDTSRECMGECGT